MIKQIIFEDEITLWWEKKEIAEKANAYKLFLNGTLQGETDKTHYSFINLKAEQAYQVRVEAYLDGVKAGQKEYALQTKKAKNKIDVTKAPYNAVGNGETLNTKALQKALDDCTENDVVYIPAGRFLTGALDVHSDTEIYLEEGAVLKGTETPNDYLPKIVSRFEGTEMMCYRSLLNLGVLDNKAGYNCKNVAFRGKGEICGGGRPLATAILESEKVRLKEFMEQNAEYVKTCENSDTIPGRARGRLINMSNCENIVMAGVTMQYGPSWNIHFVYSKDIITYGCVIRSNKKLNPDGTMFMDHVWNGDGWDPDSSEDCVVFDTDFDTGDDCIAIKSGKNPEGNIVNRPTKGVYIFNCRTISGHSVSIGSEMSGGVENVYIWDCDLTGCYFGVQIKGTKKRGAYVKNLYVCDTIMPTVYVRSVKYNDDGIGAEHPPIFSDYYFDNITLTGFGEEGSKDFVYLCGFDEPGYEVKNVHFNNVTLVNAKDDIAVRAKYTENLTWKNIRYINEDTES